MVTPIKIPVITDENIGETQAFKLTQSMTNTNVNFSEDTKMS